MTGTRVQDWRDIRFRGGQVTRSFDDWRLEEGYLRSYVELGLKLMEHGYQRIWDELAQRPSDGEGPDLFDLMDEAVGGLTTYQYEQIHLSGALRDGVTIFELYHEKAFQEIVVMRSDLRLATAERSPYWDDLRKAWRILTGMDIAPAGVDEIRKRRHWLAHQRGEIRSERQRRLYDSEAFGFPDDALQLTAARVIADLDELARAIIATDVVAHGMSWGGDQVSASTIEKAVKAVHWPVDP